MWSNSPDLPRWYCCWSASSRLCWPRCRCWSLRGSRSRGGSRQGPEAGARCCPGAGWAAGAAAACRSSRPAAGGGSSCGRCGTWFCRTSWDQERFEQKKRAKMKWGCGAGVTELFGTHSEGNSVIWRTTGFLCCPEITQCLSRLKSYGITNIPGQFKTLIIDITEFLIVISNPCSSSCRPRGRPGARGYRGGSPLSAESVGETFGVVALSTHLPQSLQGKKLVSGGAGTTSSRANVLSSGWQVGVAWQKHHHSVSWCCSDQWPESYHCFIEFDCTACRAWLDHAQSRWHHDRGRGKGEALLASKAEKQQCARLTLVCCSRLHSCCSSSLSFSCLSCSFLLR